MNKQAERMIRKGIKRDIKNNEVYTRRQWLTIKMLLHGSDVWTAIEAVSSTALAHPEWDMDEKKTWEDWEAG